MKPLSPAANLRRFESSQTLAWLLDLDGPGFSLRAANMSVSLDGDSYQPVLLETPDWRMESGNGLGGRVTTLATIRIADASFDEPSSPSSSSIPSLAGSLLLRFLHGLHGFAPLGLAR